MYTYNQLKNGDKTLSQAEEDQRKFRSDLGQISSGYRKSEHQLNTIKNVKNLFNSTQNIINLLNDNPRIRSEAFSKANKKTTGTGLKILTSKQLLQRLPIALTQVKQVNSGSLLNEIRQFVYSLYQSKEITKKVYNNIVSSRYTEIAFNYKNGYYIYEVKK